MFHPTTNFGFSAVILFLFFGQESVAITFFRPTGIGIFLKFFVGQFLSFLRNFAIFDLSVFITAISLTGYIYKCSIYNRAFVSNNTMVLNSKMQSYGGLPALLFLSLIKTDAMIGTIAQFT